MTTRLESFKRPVIAFDPTNKEHRAWYAEYHETNSWGKCPVRFAVPDDMSGRDLPSVLKGQILQYYLTQEFSAEIVC